MSNFKTELKQSQNDFFSNVKKNIIFKTSQKNDCAKYVSSSFKEDDLVNKTVFVIDDVNIFFDYGVFKVYATNDTYPIILNHILSLVDTCIQKHGYYHFHMDLNTFSVSAAERYKQFIEKFVESCINSKTTYSYYLRLFCIYNTPSSIDMIKKLFDRFIPAEVKTKLMFYSKTESPLKLTELMKI
jgi:hypothetical protein